MNRGQLKRKMKMAQMLFIYDLNKEEVGEPFEKKNTSGNGRAMLILV